MKEQINDPQIEKHLQRIKDLNKELMQQQGCITAQVLIRQTFSRRDGNGNLIIPEKELMEWFCKGLHLHEYTEYDTI